MSTRSSTRNPFSPLDNPELTIRRRPRVDPNLLNDFNMATNKNGDDVLLIGGGDLPVPDLRTMEELCQLTLKGRGGPIAPIAIQETNFGLQNDMIKQVQICAHFVDRVTMLTSILTNFCMSPKVADNVCIVFACTIYLARFILIATSFLIREILLSASFNSYTYEFTNIIVDSLNMFLRSIRCKSWIHRVVVIGIHVPEPKHLEYHAPSDDDIQVEDADEDPEEDPEEYLSEKHELEDDNEDPKEDPNEEHELEDFDETEPLEEDETAVTPPPPRHHGARISAQLGRRAAMIRMRDDILKKDMPPQRRFVLTDPLPGCDVPERHGLVHNPGHNAWTIARATDRAEDIGYVRALQAFEQRMMTSIEEVNLRTDRRDIRLKIDVVRGQRTTYETKLQKVHQAYLSFEARNRALLARLETLETHMIRMEWQRQSAEDLAITQMMHIHTLEARAHTDTVEDADSGCNLKKLYPYSGRCKPKVKGNNVATDTQRFQELALMCTKFFVDETEKVDKYISGLLDNIHGNVMSARHKTLDETIKLANDLMDNKLRTYAERQNENKRKTDNNQQQQPHKKQNVARAYTADLGEKKVYTQDLPLCTKCNYHHTGQCIPKCGKCKRYGHTTMDCQAITNNDNNNKNQKAEACYKCGNTGHIKRSCPKLNNRENDIAQGRAYVLGGRDASPNSNVITGRINLRRTSITGFLAQSNSSSNTIALDSPHLLVLNTGASESRQHVDTSLIHIESSNPPTAELFDVDSGRISIRHCEY
nr:hypothetical protein [Tanacetum cinerariifolium]